MPFEIVTMGHKELLFEIVTVEHKELPSKTVTVKEIGLGISKIVIMKEIRLRIIFFLLGILNLEKKFFNCRKNLGKKLVMTWLLMWLNLSVATLNTTLQLLVIYRYRLDGHVAQIWTLIDI